MEDTMETDPAKDQVTAGNTPPSAPQSVPPPAAPALSVPNPLPTPAPLQIPIQATPSAAPVVPPPAPAAAVVAQTPQPLPQKQSPYTIELPPELVASAGGVPVKPLTPTATNAKAKDLLHFGNAIAVAQGKVGVSITSAPNPPQGESSTIETPFERSLKESGLKEGFPRPSQEPERGQALEGDGTGLPKIHTYAGDMNALMKKGATLSSIVVAEQSRAQTQLVEAPQKKNPVRWLWLVGATVLIALGILVVGGVLYLIQPQKTTVPSITQNLIPINSKETLTLDDSIPLAKKLGNLKASANLAIGNIDEIDVLKGGVPVSPEELLTELGAPNELARNATQVVIGIHSFNHNQPFLIVTVSAYDRTFQGMLAWEETIASGLGTFFAPSSVSTTQNIFPPPLTFSDHVVANIDVRESQSEWPILYAFPRQNLLILTTNESTLREILTRLTLQSRSGE